MDAKFEIIKSSIPQKTSNTEEWISWWKLLLDYYGKTMASNIFVITWKDRGGSGSGADVVKLRTATGVPLDNQTISDSAETLASKGLSALESLGDTYKYGLYAVAGLVFVLAAGLVYRAVTASASDIGTVAGTALKAAA